MGDEEKSKNILTQIEELTEKAHKYEHMKDRYIPLAKKLTDTIQKMDKLKEELLAIAKDIDPLIGMKERKSGTRKSKAEVIQIVEEQYKKMEMGLQVSVESIMKDHPEMPEESVKALFYNRLSHAPKVMKRKNGLKSILYIQKNV